MKLKELKEIINTLTEKELEQEVTYSSENHSISGVVNAVTKAKENLYWDGEDDPSTLIPEKDIDPEELDDYEMEVKKGELVFWLDEIQA